MSELIKSNEIKCQTDKLLVLADDLLAHDSFGDIRIKIDILKRQPEDVIIHYGKQYRLSPKPYQYPFNSLVKP